MGFLAYILPVDGGGGRPDNSLPGIPGRPDNSLPGSQPGIDNSLPGGWPARPDQGLPGSQPGVDNSLPGQPGRPDQGLPPGASPKVGTAIAGQPPAQVDAQNGVWVLVAVQGKYVWAWAQQTQAPAAPDNTLPAQGSTDKPPGGQPKA